MDRAADIPRVLVIAGSDSGGGAGLQADIKTLTRFGVYAATAVTAVTVQNTLGVSDIHPIPTPILTAQIKAVVDDIGADAIKIGMLGDEATIQAVASALSDFEGPIILDPVIVATSGDRLIPLGAVAALQTKLLPKATVLTPNIPEAELLTGLSIKSEADMIKAGHMLLGLGVKAAAMKGGHLPSETLVDLLIEPTEITRLEVAKVDTRHTHGTGCTFASALAAGLASGKSPQDSFSDAQAFVQSAIACAPGFGGGSGPLGHTEAVVPVGGKENG